MVDVSCGKNFALEERKNKMLKYSRKIVGDTGWLSPDGKFYACSEGDYIKVADALGLHENQMERLGWIKLFRGNIFQGVGQPGIPDPTQKQYDLVYEYCQANNKQMPSWFNKEK